MIYTIYKCDNCNKTINRTNHTVVYSLIKPEGNSYKVIIKTIGSKSAHKYTMNNSYKRLCRKCTANTRRMLMDDNVKKSITNELLDLCCGKINNVMICNALEEGNGK